VVLEFYTGQVPSTDTVANELQLVLQFWQKSHPDATVCQPAQAGNVPNGPAGAFEGICLTFTSQNGQALPYKVLIYLALAPAQGGGPQLLLGADARFPQGMDNKTLDDVVGSVWGSVHWAQLSGG
jgi:hypothetical protein